MSDAISLSVDEDPLLVYFSNNVYDISKFKHKHPGGKNTLTGVHKQDIEYRLLNAPAHSDAAIYLLQEYKVSINDVRHSTRSEIDFNNNTDYVMSKKMCNATNVQQNNSDTMEHLVDWSSAMLSQIPKLGNHYFEWVNKPVDRPLRLFHSDFIEMFTKTPWWLVPLIWVPIIYMIILSGIEAAYSSNLRNRDILLNLIIGMILWTFVEYVMHRWVFHLDMKGASMTLCTVHFLLHGLHHKVPFDPYRLVFPPLPAMFLAWLFYIPIMLTCNCPKVIISGGLIGYLAYDMIHYYIHYGNPSNCYMYNLKRYHYQHHFVHHDRGFGISSPLWDIIFDTRIILRKLQYLLKW